MSLSVRVTPFQNSQPLFNPRTLNVSAFVFTPVFPDVKSVDFKKLLITLPLILG